jgi:toxin ParE1/3/4
LSQVILAPEADADLWEITRYIARRNLPAAYRLVDTVSQLGRARDKLERGLRSFPIGPFVLSYRCTAQHLEIARILRGSRDIPSRF